MALKISDNITGFVLTDQQANREYFNYVDGRFYRDVCTRVYSAHFRDGAECPVAPVNPGKLKEGKFSVLGEWQCVNRSVSREYGAPLSTTYQETWETKSDLIKYADMPATKIDSQPSSSYVGWVKGGVGMNNNDYHDVGGAGGHYA